MATFDEAIATLPPPNSEAIRSEAQTTSTHASIDTTDDPAVARTARQHLELVLQSLRAEAAQEKDQITADLQSHIQDLHADADSRIAYLHAAERSARALDLAQFSDARVELQNVATRTRIELATVSTSELARIDTETAARVAEVETQCQQRQLALTHDAENARAQPPIIAANEADRSDRELEAAAVDCERAGDHVAARYPGPDDVRIEQRAAARTVGYDSAADIRAKKTSIRQDLSQRAQDFSGDYLQYAANVNAQIGHARDALVPAIRQRAAGAANAIREAESHARIALDQRLTTELAALNTAENRALQHLHQATLRAITSVRQNTQRATAILETVTLAGHTAINHRLNEVDEALGDPSLTVGLGSFRAVEEGRGAVASIGSATREQLQTATEAGRGQIQIVNESFDFTVSQLQSENSAVTQRLTNSASTALGLVVDTHRAQAQENLAAMILDQDRLQSQVLSEIDRAAGDARRELRDINERFRTDVHQAANDSIQEAIRPKTDVVETRAAEAAEQVDDAWYEGLFRAIGQIVIGLVILVVVALVVAAIAAVFYVTLTAWAAIMIAGALLLAAGFILALIQRSQQESYQGRTGAVIGRAFLDAIGFTGIQEAWTGRDVGTDQRLSAGERTERGILGVVTLVSLVFGVRAAIKGPPGGAMFRPSSMPRGWTGIRGIAGRMAEGVKSVGGEMISGVAGGLRRFRDRWSGRGPEEPLLAEPDAGQKPQRRDGESVEDYSKRTREWFNRKREQSRYESEQDQRLANARNEITNAENQQWYDNASPRQRRLAYDPDHRGVINDQGINEARFGLEAERQGVVDGPIRRPLESGGGDFVDGRGRIVDVKSSRGSAEAIADNLVSERVVLLDRSGTTDPGAAPMNDAQFRSLLDRVSAELMNRGRPDLAQQVPRLIKPIPPLATDLSPPFIPSPEPETSRLPESVPEPATAHDH
jgi:hypothetical protein